MPAFSGTYYYTVDDKGRLIIPAPLRELISSHYSSRLLITNALFDKCLQLFPFEEWTKLEEKVRELPRTLEEVHYFKRRVIASAQECAIDKQGRILIPAALREDAGIKDDIVIAGLVEKIELWDRSEWNAVMDPSRFDRRTVEERLASLGL
jgi:transcriptional regulator MraZ